MQARSMRGKTVNMGQLMAANQTKVAIGNARLNARGDRVAPGGAIIETHEQIMTEYNTTRLNAVRHVGMSDIAKEALTPAEAMAQIRKQDAQQHHTPTHEKSLTPKRKIADSE